MSVTGLVGVVARFKVASVEARCEVGCLLMVKGRCFGAVVVCCDQQYFAYL